MQRKLFLIRMFVFFVCASIYRGTSAQSKEELKEAKIILKEANRYYRQGDYRDAVREYEKIIDYYTEDAKFNFRLGVSYLHSYSQPKDLEFLEKTYRLDAKVDKQINYWLGKANHLNYNFKKAHDFYELHLKSLKKYQKAQRLELLNVMEQTTYAKYLCEIPQEYIIEKVEGGINTQFSEHSPITSMDGSTLIYTSRHPVEGNDKMDFTGEYLEKIYFTTKNDSGLWNPPTLLNIDPDFKNHLATMQLFDNGNQMLLYKSTHQGDIYITNKLSDSSWSVPIPYENINSPDFEADVYHSSVNDLIFISTDRFSRDGNLDIFYSELQEDSTWGELISVGNEINTPFDENSPFLSNDGKTLYFSSNGHKSMGGYDVFKSEKDSITGEWGPISNMGYPINTPDDDVYFYFGYNGWTGYTSSYRTGGLGEKDIYKITFVPNVNIVGNIIDGKTLERLEDVEISFTAEGRDTVFLESDLTDEKDDGKFNVNILSNQQYDVYFVKNGDTLDKKEYTVPFLVEGDPVYYLKDFYLYEEPDTTKPDTIPTPIVVQVDTIPDNPAPLVVKKIEAFKEPEKKEENILIYDENGELKKIRNVYFPFDSYKFESKYNATLESLARILNERDDIIVKILGHADDKGSAPYNIKLSNLRARSVYKYLLAQGVSPDKILQKGLGFSQPLVSNDDEIDGRELNRRCEFVIYEAVK